MAYRVDSEDIRGNLVEVDYYCNVYCASESWDLAKIPEYQIGIWMMDETDYCVYCSRCAEHLSTGISDPCSVCQLEYGS